MKYLVLLALIAVAPSTVLAQETEEITLPDAVMERVVRHVVNSHFNRSSRKQVVYFSDHLIKAKWLPKLRNKTFIVMDNIAAAQSDREFHIVYQITSEAGRYNVWFGSGSGCSFTGDIWSFRMIGNKLSISKTKGGWGSGCGSSSGSGSSSCGPGGSEPPNLLFPS